MSPLFIGLMTFGLIVMVAAGLYGVMFDNHHLLEERIQNMAVRMRVMYGDEGAMDAAQDGVASALFRWASVRLPEPRRDSPQGQKLSRTLVQAGFLRSDALRRFQVALFASATAGSALGLVCSLAVGAGGAGPVLYMILGTVLGVYAPNYYVQRRARLRQSAIARELSEVLDLLVVTVEAGLGLSEAIKVVGGEAERQRQAIGQELNFVSAEIAAGASLGQALRSMSDRTAVADIKPLAATLIQSEQLGAQIAPALKSISDALRDRRRLRAEEAAQKTTVKILFPLVLFILPAMIAVIMGPAVIQITAVLGR